MGIISGQYGVEERLYGDSLAVVQDLGMLPLVTENRMQKQMDMTWNLPVEFYYYG